MTVVETKLFMTHPAIPAFNASSQKETYAFLILLLASYSSWFVFQLLVLVNVSNMVTASSLSKARNNLKNLYNDKGRVKHLVT